MIVTYVPEDGTQDKHEWQFVPRKVLSAEAEAVEDATGWTWDEFAQRLLSGSMKAKRALVWMLLKRENPPLRFKDVSISASEIEVDFDADEAARVREALDDMTDIDEDQRVFLTEALDKRIAESAPSTGKDPSIPGGSTG